MNEQPAPGGMPHQTGSKYSVPELRVSKACERCGKTFFQTRTLNCHNCGVMICTDCCTNKVKLKKFGYNGLSLLISNNEVYTLDEKELKNLSSRTLKRYLEAYNIAPENMLMKDELIVTILKMRPLPDDSEVFFREHMPSTVDGWASLHEEFTRTSATSGSTARFWDLDKFFAKLPGISPALKFQIAVIT
ncbi:hypothetical protein BGZ58_009168 [Dissophora ornata]|nr:hypothetical protein BGZ58_009168 [Dissophora ornata]